MIELHPEIVVKDDKQFVILPYEEFAAIQEALSDAEDLASLRTAKKEEHDAATVPFEQVIDDLGLSA